MTLINDGVIIIVGCAENVDDTVSDSDVIAYCTNRLQKMLRLTHSYEYSFVSFQCLHDS